MKVLLAVVAVFLITGCTSTPLRIPTPQDKLVDRDYQVLGQGEGSSTGIMLFQLIPINQNDRFQNAYDEAVKSKGGDRLLDPVVEERWFWAWVLNGYTTKISGTVVKDTKK
ncbi:MAG: hypothetical protein FD174_3000 [Geobacteraceae bacterium]|nr:MAG: hypothetical protein FD174_3000 [Geobacteraceae bacterium]